MTNEPEAGFRDQGSWDVEENAVGRSGIRADERS